MLQKEGHAMTIGIAVLLGLAFDILPLKKNYRLAFYVVLQIFSCKEMEESLQ